MILKILLLFVASSVLFIIFIISKTGLTTFESSDTTTQRIASTTIYSAVKDLFNIYNTPVASKDITSGMILTFNEEFNNFVRYVDANGNVTCESGGNGRWQTVFNFCYRTNPNNYEEQVYIDPGFIAYLKNKSATSSEVDADNPFSVTNGILSIKAAPSKIFPKNITRLCI